MIVYTLPGIMAFVWLLKFPESPRFLLMRNQHAEAVKAMEWVMKANIREDKNTFGIVLLEAENSTNNNMKIANDKDK